MLGLKGYVTSTQCRKERCQIWVPLQARPTTAQSRSLKQERKRSDVICRDHICAVLISRATIVSPSAPLTPTDVIVLIKSKYDCPTLSFGTATSGKLLAYLLNSIWKPATSDKKTPSRDPKREKTPQSSVVWGEIAAVSAVPIAEPRLCYDIGSRF